MSTTSRRQPALRTSRLLIGPTVGSAVGALVAAAALILTLLASVPSQAQAPSAASAPAAAPHKPTRVRISVLPQIHQPSATAARRTAAKSVVTVTTDNKRMERRVKLQRKTAAGWRTVATRWIRGGEVRFPVIARKAAVYRAVVMPSHAGRRPLRTAPVRDTWGSPDWADEFDGDALGSAWEHRIQFYNPWGGRSCSKGDPSAVAVAGGTLRLSSMPDPAAHGRCVVKDDEGNVVGQYPYRLNGHVSTQRSADFRYGIAAARMRFPRSLGQHASFWLQPRGLLTTGTTPWGAEIDVVEWYGTRKNRRVMAMAVHQPMPDGSKRQIGGTIPDPDRYLATRKDSWWTRFHVFSVEWTPDKYVFRIDDHRVWVTREGISHVPQFLILSMLSSDFELPDVGEDPNPRTAEVDWVAFWKDDRA